MPDYQQSMEKYQELEKLTQYPVFLLHYNQTKYCGDQLGFHDFKMLSASSICSLVSVCMINSAATVYPALVFTVIKNSARSYKVVLYTWHQLELW